MPALLGTEARRATTFGVTAFGKPLQLTLVGQVADQGQDAQLRRAQRACHSSCSSCRRRSTGRT
jgi:hypothetical protein